MKTYSELAQFLNDNGGKYSYDWYMSNTRRLVAMYRECDKEVTAAASKQVRAAITAEKAIRNEAYADRLEELFGVRSAGQLSFAQKKDLFRMEMLDLI